MNAPLNTRMLIPIFLLLFTRNASSQVFRIIPSISHDSIYLNEYLLSIVKKDTINDKVKYFCLYRTSDDKLMYSFVVDRYLDTTYNMVKRKHKTDKFLGLPVTKIIGNKLVFNNQIVGKFIEVNANEIKHYSVTLTVSTPFIGLG